MLTDRAARSTFFYRRTFLKCFLPSCSLFGQAISEEKILFFNRPIRNNQFELLYTFNKYDIHRQLLFLIGRFLKIFSSETASPNERKVTRKHLWKALYKDCQCCPNPLTNMAATGNYVSYWPIYLNLLL